LIEPIAFAHLGVAHLNGVENNAVEALQRDLVALVFFELRRLQRRTLGEEVLRYNDEDLTFLLRAGEGRRLFGNR